MDKQKLINDYSQIEITLNYPTLSPDIIFKLTRVAIALFNRTIPEEDAIREFKYFTSDFSVLNKIIRIRNVSDRPNSFLINEPLSAKSLYKRKKSIPWNEVEDIRLVAAISKHGARDWKKIAEFVGGRTSSQCNQRWCRALDPQINHGNWTEEEDAKLLKAVEMFGNVSWCQIAKSISGRTDLQCRYRYFQLCKINKDENSTEESAKKIPSLELKNLPNAKPRRNTIPIAPFDLNGDGSFEMLPYYLESSLTPRQDKGGQYLHRVPPMLASRKCRK